MSYSIETRFVDRFEPMIVQLVCGCRFQVGVFGADTEQAVFTDCLELMRCGRANCHFGRIEELEVDTEEVEPV